MKFPPWHQRPDDFDPAQHREGVLDSQSFLRVADQFISLANQRNKKIDSTELQMVMLYAAARYAAHVGKKWRLLHEDVFYQQHCRGRHCCSFLLCADEYWHGHSFRLFQHECSVVVIPCNLVCLNTLADR